MEKGKLFADFDGGDEKSSKGSKFWLVSFTSFVVIVLLVLFYLMVIRGGISPGELQKSLQIVWTDSIWAEKEVSPYETIIVPTVILKVKNIGDRPLKRVGFQGIFEFVDSGEKHTDGYTQVFSEPLMPGDVSEPITIRAFHGYTASSKAAFLKNKESWKKMAVRIFVRAPGSGLVPVGDLYPIKQEIEGIDPRKDEKEMAAKEADIKKVLSVLQVAWQDSKWLDKKVTTDRAYIIPSITVKIKNTGDGAVKNVAFKGVFEVATTGKRVGEGFVTALKQPLQPGELSDEILIKSDLGYSATSKEAFFKNILNWDPIKVKVFARFEDTGFALLGIYPVKKEIEGIKVIYQ